MSGLFGSANSTSAASSANATQGDISKDVQLTSPPEDSISDLAFSSASEHLAVASWDKKVRIYEIDGQGNSQGKAIIDHEGPVLSCCWSKVGLNILRSNTKTDDIFRMAQKYLALEQTKLPVCLTSDQTQPHKSRHTTNRFVVWKAFRYRGTTCWLQDRGTRPSSTGT